MGDIFVDNIVNIVRRPACQKKCRGTVRGESIRMIASYLQGVSSSLAHLAWWSLASFLLAVIATPEDDPATQWRAPGDKPPLPAVIEYGNDYGRVGIVNTDGPIGTGGHPCYEPTVTKGRACVTCHQPADGMSIALDTIRERWDATNGADQLVAAIDGSNCPNLPQAEAESHSLLLERGLFRISLPWPPRPIGGAPVTPAFSLEVVRDPTG